jgi:hypothetical protein
VVGPRGALGPALEFAAFPFHRLRLVAACFFIPPLAGILLAKRREPVPANLVQKIIRLHDDLWGNIFKIHFHLDAVPKFAAGMNLTHFDLRAG